jgi:phosphate transport system permease protein
MADRVQRRSASRRVKERVTIGICFACAAISVLTTVGIIVSLFGEAAGFFSRVSIWAFLTGRDWSPLFSPPSYGVLPLAMGTLLITAGAAVIAIPIGLLVAIFLSDYATPRARAWLKPALELLAGIPTVVYGYFGITVVTPVLRKFIPGVGVFNAMSGAIVVGIMILPLMSSLCEEALAAVPRSLREGAYALGATKREAIQRVVVPAALSGIVSAAILAISRAVGETMAVTLAAGATPKMTLDPRESIQTMTAFIVQVSQGDAPAGSPAYHSIFAIGATLFLLTLVMNLVARALVRRFRNVYE